MRTRILYYRRWIGTLLVFLFSFVSSKAQFIEKLEFQLFFETDVDQLDPQAQQIIRQKILELNEQTIKEIYIQGHADSDASDEYNIGLSERRAIHTREYLFSLGVKSRMVKLDAFGESKPLSDLKAMNRRVDVVFVYEVFGSPELYEGRKVIQGVVYNADTKERLPASFVVELARKNNFKKTNKKAYFRLYSDGAKDIKLVFYRKGFLSQTITVNKSRIAHTKDTLSLSIYLNPIKVKEKLTFDKIYFYTDTDKLKPDSKDDLENLLNYMRSEEEAIIEIQGHMNFPLSRHASPFQRIYNRTLSYNRARAIYSYLLKHGISANRMSYKGMSNFDMVYPYPTTTEEEDANKRVEAWVLEVQRDSTAN